MDAIARPMRLGYEAQFSAPSFDLPGRSTELLQSLYGNLATRYSISPGDMHVLGGSSLADTSVRVALFGGSGRIDVTVDKLSIDFDKLLTDSDIEICKDCITTSEQTIQEFRSDMNIDVTFANLNYTIELGDGIESASDYLSQVAAPGISLDLKEIEGAVAHPGIRLGIENENEKWSVSISAEQRVGEKKSISVSIFATFNGDSAVHRAANRIDLLSRLIDLFCKGIGLNVSVYSLNSASGGAQ